MTRPSARPSGEADAGAAPAPPTRRTWPCAPQDRATPTVPADDARNTGPAGEDGVARDANGWRWDVPIHVDAASGGFVAPFLTPELLWDFRLDRVHSINVSGHKFGLVYPGVGWVIWRESSDLPKELIFQRELLISRL